MNAFIKFIFDILIVFSAWFSLIAGIFGIVLFLVMLLSLRLLRKLGQIFNKTYSIKKMEYILSKNIEFNLKKLFFKYAKWAGSILCIVCVFIIFFLVYRVDINSFLNVLKVKPEFKMLWLIILQSFQAVFVGALLFAFFYGIMLIFCEDFAKKLNESFSRTFNIDEKIQESFEKTITKDIDTISFLRNRVIGLVGFLISVILTILAVYDIASVI